MSSGLAVVSGASTGIGQATAVHLAATGLHVLAGVRNDAAAAARAAERMSRSTSTSPTPTRSPMSLGG